MLFMMKSLFTIGVIFFLYDAYHDGVYSSKLITLQQNYKPLMYLFVGFAVLYAIQLTPTESKDLLYKTGMVMQHLPLSTPIPIERIQPYIEKMHGYVDAPNGSSSTNYSLPFVSATSTKKRAVSETKKKYIASNQNWKCGDCKRQLDHTFEVDHRIRLEHGGSNDVSNLVALCRNCHGLKTSSENM
jgi:hypothetical protein